jgi:predicted DNA-binding protein with PD1-like motif
MPSNCAPCLFDYTEITPKEWNDYTEVQMKTYTFRLKPGYDLFDSIEAFAVDKKIKAGCVLSAVGSLTHATLRLANREFYNEYEGHFEIVSMTGTVAISGSHIHISISDGGGVTIGGHLVSGCKIYTTAEIVLAVFEDVVYARELLENDSGYEELVVYKKQPACSK